MAAVAPSILLLPVLCPLVVVALPTQLVSPLTVSTETSILDQSTCSVNATDSCADLAAICVSNHCTCPLGTLWSTNSQLCAQLNCTTTSAFASSKLCLSHWPTTRCTEGGLCICEFGFELDEDGVGCVAARWATVVRIISVVGLLVVVVWGLQQVPEDPNENEV